MKRVYLYKKQNENGYFRFIWPEISVEREKSFKELVRACDAIIKNVSAMKEEALAS